MIASPQKLTVLWRGSLASCNYGCGYCPFAKTDDDKPALARDKAALARFEDWASSRPYALDILITPWGEALIRNYYRDAMRRLSHLTNIETIAIQTNLSCSVSWLSECNLERIALWTTYHPGETPRAEFLSKIDQLERMGARYSVGVVGLREHFEEIDALRRDLPQSAYLWVNAYKRTGAEYSAAEIERLTTIDPLFELNNRSYASEGRPCHAGETAISVLADGMARRCHFLPEPIANIFDADFEAALVPRPCTAQSCRCHIGYSHLKELDLGALYGRGFPERRPDLPVARADARRRIERFDSPGRS